MARPLDPRIREILLEHGEDPDDKQGVIWDCHGTWVVYHRAIERIAAKAGVVFDPPTILRAERDEAVILVHGELKGRRDWDIGECLVGVNYRVSQRQAAYVWAMATKRARDRLVLKLIGLHGLLYSEEEADDFKEARPRNGNGAKSEPLPEIAKSANPNQARGNGDWQKIMDDLIVHSGDSYELLLWANSRYARLSTHPWGVDARDEWAKVLTAVLARECHSPVELERWRHENRPKIDHLPTDWQLAASGALEDAIANFRVTA